jgi:23S rRNA (adenine2030-N6)-methyltransferase
MNYRHAYHAGNFADVLKHVVLCRVLVHLKEKPTSFRVIDIHAGAGLYDLTAAEPNKTGEWRDGIGRLWKTTFDADVCGLLQPYLEVVAAYNPGGALKIYPGSPEIARCLLRRQDRLIACELEPGAARALARNMRGDARAKALTMDGWTALAAFVPPKERRGLVLLDPPFEQPDDFGRLAQGLERAHRKWATGIYMLWYPLKDAPGADAFGRRLRQARIPRVLRMELVVAPAGDTKLGGAGLVVVNPPWTLENELKRLGPALAQALGREGKGRFRADWLAREAVK